MIEAVTRERWQEAQAAELSVVTYDLENSRRATQHIFDYLGIKTDQHDRMVAEIGCGPYPAVMFCENVRGIVFEPLFSKPDHCGINVFWNQCAFEDFDYDFGASECWIFNALQHVRDPELVITKAKQCAPVIRFFEPVDYGTCVYHPHTFSEDNFRRWFGDSVRRYTDRLAGFFDADCCYGTWQR